MSSAGHVLDAIKRMQANRLLQKQYRNAYRNKLLKLNNSTTSGLTPLSPEEIKLERTKLKRQVKLQSTYKLISFTILAFIIISITLAYFLFT